ncbi:MAG: hypothetical protein IPL79_08720 [Myxococcales bacterium]|nr:hypothetical protein [Myxococcales bacterium]
MKEFARRPAASPMFGRVHLGTLAALAALACTALAACSSHDKLDVPGLVAPASTGASLTLAEATKSPTTLGAYLRAARLQAGALGPFTATLTSTIETSSGTPGGSETLTNEVTLRVAANGDYHAIDHNSADLGREVISLGDQLYLRPRYAKWHQRVAQDGEASDLLATWLTSFADHLEPVAGGLTVSAGEASKHLGRDALRVELGKAATTKVATEALVQRKWRESITVQEIAGYAVIDGLTGVVLDGELVATLQFLRDGKPIAMKLAARHRVALGPVELAPPAASDVVATPQRLREVDDAKTLLNGL